MARRPTNFMILRLDIRQFAVHLDYQLPLGDRKPMVVDSDRDHDGSSVDDYGDDYG